MRKITAAQIDACIRVLVKARAPASICPSDVARALAPDDFRPLMQRVRDRAAKLAQRGAVLVTQRGRPVDVATARGPVRIVAARDRTSYADAYRNIDFRAHPELYRIGKGEQGVLVAEPYKSELLSLWKFRTPDVARMSAAALWKAFVAYRKERDFVGMDMARKFIQMGFTRARRYANHASGKKYDGAGLELPADVDTAKAEAAAIFKAMWDRVEADATYRRWRARAKSASSPR